MDATATEPAGEALQAEAIAPPAPELFTGSLTELVHALRIEAWRSHGRWAPFIVEGGFIAAMRVRSDFRRELVAKAPGARDGFERWARVLRQAAEIKARSHGGWTSAQVMTRAADGAPTVLRWIELYEREVTPGTGLCVECGAETPWKGGVERPRCWACIQRGVHDD